MDGYTHNIDDVFSQLTSSFEIAQNNIEAEIVKIEKNLKFDYTDKDDVVKSFVDDYAKPPLKLKTKLDWSTKADIRFKNGIYPGITDLEKIFINHENYIEEMYWFKKQGKNTVMKKKEFLEKKHNFQQYGDVFIWFYMIENLNTYNEVIFIENEKKADWWDERNIDIQPILRQEWNEEVPECKLTMISFDKLIKEYSNSEGLDPKSITEILKFKEELDKLEDIETYDPLIDVLTNFEYYHIEELNDCFINNVNLNMGSVDSFDIEIEEIEEIERIIAYIDYEIRIVNIEIALKIHFRANGIRYYSREYSDSFFGSGIFNVTASFDYDFIFGDKNIHLEPSKSDFSIELDEFDEEFEEDEDI